MTFLIPLFVCLGAMGDLGPPGLVSPPPPPVSLGDLAQRAVRAAVHASGIPRVDADVSGIAERARLSALAPELSVRVTHTQNGLTDYSSDTGTVSTSISGPGLSVQGALTFHFDRLVYSGQEARLERIRTERVDARTRVAQRVIDEVGRWSRASMEEAAEPPGSPQHLDATIRRTNAQMALDVWTDGWFSSFLAGHERP